MTNEPDELIQLLQVMVDGRPHLGNPGAVVDAVTKHSGDDLASLVVQVDFHESATGTKHSTRFDEVEHLAGFHPSVSYDLPRLAEELVVMIRVELDEILYAID